MAAAFADVVDCPDAGAERAAFGAVDAAVGDLVAGARPVPG